MEIQKYDIYLINLDPKKGHTQAGWRPCVVIQNNLFNQHSPTVIVIPLTTTDKKIFPSEFLITPSKTNGLTTQSRFLGSQIITVDKDYFVKKIGKLEEKYFENVIESLDVSLDLHDTYYHLFK